MAGSEASAAAFWRRPIRLQVGLQPTGSAQAPMAGREIVGVGPAWRASRIDPVVALRGE